MVRRATEYFGGSLTVAAARREPARPAVDTAHDRSLPVDAAVSEVDAREHSAVVFLGIVADSTRELPTDADLARNLRRLCEQMRREGKPIAALGAGLDVLREIDPQLPPRRNPSAPSRVVMDQGVWIASDSSSMKELMQQVFANMPRPTVH
jgi:putative intracellular protease/amidase